MEPILRQGEPSPLGGAGGTGSPDPQGLERPGVVGLSLISDAASTGLGIVGNTVGLLGEVVNSTWDTVAGEVGQNRLSAQTKLGVNNGIDNKYIDMVNAGQSLSDVADIMANDGVAITNGVPYDLLLSVFMDPFNVVLAGTGKAITVGQKSADIQSRITPTGIDHAVETSRYINPASPSELKWLKEGRGKVLMGEMYKRASHGLNGVKAATALAMFGRTAGMAIAVTGAKVIETVLKFADDAGTLDNATEAVATAAHNITSNAGADLVVQRITGSNRATAITKAEIIKSSSGVSDLGKKAEFIRFSSQATGSYSPSLDEINMEWELLHTLAKGSTKEEVAASILKRDVAASINERVGISGRESLVEEALRTQDAVYTKRVLEARKESYVSENMFLLADAPTAAGRIAIARAEFVRSVAGVLPEQSAMAAFDVIAEGVTDVRGLAEILYGAKTIHMGVVAKTFGRAKASLIARLDGPGRNAAMAALPQQIRNIVINQSPRWSIVAKDTMTNEDYKKLLKALTETEDITTQSNVALAAVYGFKSLRDQYAPRAFEALLRRSPKEAVDSLISTLKAYGGPDNFPLEVPVKNWLDPRVDAALPELKILRDAASDGEYKIIMEPDTAASIPGRMYSNQVSKDVIRNNVDMWMPISGQMSDVVLGNRNMFGKMIDYLGKDRIPTGVVANTLSRMQRYAIERDIPLSRDQIITLHKKLTEYGFNSRGSIRTAYEDAVGGSNAIVSELIADISKTDPISAQKMDILKKNGTLRKLIFDAAAGDWSQVGLATGFTGRFKAMRGLGHYVTKIADQYYPQLKFRYSPFFNTQEVVESKWWNYQRGFNDEMKFSVPGTPIEIKFGNKRYYDVTGRNGEKLRLDAVEIMSNQYISSRDELKYSQEMFGLNFYMGGKAADAVVSFGDDAVGWGASMSAILAGEPGRVKNLDYLKFVTAENMPAIDGLANRLETLLPEQWSTWLAMAGGNRRAAAFIMIKERQEVTRSLSTARTVWASNKHYGIGFGREYDDDPIKLLAQARKEFKASIDKSPQEAEKALDHLASSLGVIHANAVSIGYSGDSLKSIRDALREVDKVKSGMSLTVSNKLSGAANKRIKSLMAALNDSTEPGAVGILMRYDFEKAVARKKQVRLALEADGIPKAQATEMAGLYVVAERRNEMLPNLSLAVSDSLRDGTPISKISIDGIKDHLTRIRAGRTEEETLWNAVNYGLEASQRQADATHYFRANRNMLEKTLNHPVLSFYPTSYMMGKVLPEYARALYLSPTNGLITSTVLAPYTAIMKSLGWLKYGDGTWGKYAPLVGFTAMNKIQMSMIEANSPNDPNANVLTYIFANLLIPGVPTEISVSAPRTFTAAAQAVEKSNGTIDPGNIVDAVGYAGTQQIARAVGLKTSIDTLGKAISYAGDEAEKAGGPIELAAQTIGGLVTDVTNFIQNK